MKKIFWIVSLFVAVTALSGCNDEKHGPQVPSAVQQAFEAMFPDAQGVNWTDQGGYVVAAFDAGNNTQTNVWYDEEGNWYMTETDIAFDVLPEAIRTAFAASEYAAWMVDDVEMLTREEMEPLYVIEVKQNEAEIELCYAADGVLVRAEIADGADGADGEDKDDDDPADHDDLLPGELPQAISAFIAEKYPEARVVESELENGAYEVDIIDNKVKREVLFNAEGNWKWTQTEVRRSELPEAVITAWEASQYAAWELDDADHFDSPEGVWYQLELENEETDEEATLRIREDGTVF